MGRSGREGRWGGAGGRRWGAASGGRGALSEFVPPSTHARTHGWLCFIRRSTRNGSRSSRRPSRASRSPRTCSPGDCPATPAAGRATGRSEYHAVRRVTQPLAKQPAAHTGLSSTCAENRGIIEACGHAVPLPLLLRPRSPPAVAGEPLGGCASRTCASCACATREPRVLVCVNLLPV